MPAFLPTLNRVRALTPQFGEAPNPNEGPTDPGGGGGGSYGGPPPFSGGTSCPPDFFDGGDGWCYPINQPMQPVGPTTPAPAPSGTSNIGPVQVTVNNALNIADGVSATLEQNIVGAITGIGREVASVVKSIAGAIKDAIAGVINAVGDALKNGLAGIIQIIETIANNIGGVLKGVIDYLGQHIGQILTDIKNGVIDVLKPLADHIAQIAQTVQNINDTLIKPIANIINTTIKTVADLTVAIERDLHSGLSGILDIPNQIAGGLTTIDATMQRTVQQLGAANKGVGESNIDYEGDKLPPKYSAATASMLVGKTLQNQITTTFSDKIALSSESLEQVSKEAISALSPLLKDVLNILWGICKSPFDQQHADWTAIENVFVGLLDGVLGILTTMTAVGALVEPLIDAATEEARTLIPVTKLDMGTIIAARVRGFLDDSNASSELSKLGLDSTRQKVLKDLSVLLVDINQAMDWWYRGIINDADLAKNFSEHGITPADLDAYKEGSIRLPGVDEVTRWRHFGILDDTTATNVLKSLRWDDAQIQAYLLTEQTRETAAGRANIDGRLNAAGKGWLNNTFLQATPDAVVTAGAREGLHLETTRLAWLAHWNLPPIQSIIQSYFRGYRTYTEVGYAMEANNIPSELWDELIQINRPLVPFRSIPSYVKAGYMTEAQAQAELAAHGFDTGHINIILKAIKPNSSSANAATAQTVKSLSVASARELFDLGSLSQQQYTDILVQHGYSVELAQAQAQADLLAFHTKQRKNTLAELQAEVLAGVTAIDDAVSQLGSLGFSQAEISVFQIKVSKALKVNVKHPSISEMKAFIKAGYLQLDAFKAELQAQGWSEPWLSIWVAMETPPPALPAPA